MATYNLKDKLIKIFLEEFQKNGNLHLDVHNPEPKILANKIAQEIIEIASEYKEVGPTIDAINTKEVKVCNFSTSELVKKNTKLIVGCNRLADQVEQRSLRKIADELLEISQKLEEVGQKLVRCHRRNPRPDELLKLQKNDLAALLIEKLREYGVKVSAYASDDHGGSSTSVKVISAVLETTFEWRFDTGTIRNLISEISTLQRNEIKSTVESTSPDLPQSEIEEIIKIALREDKKSDS